MVKFAKGVNVKTVETKYGEIIKVGVKLEDFKQNPVSETGYINFDIKQGKKGKYAELNTYKKEE